MSDFKEKNIMVENVALGKADEELLREMDKDNVRRGPDPALVAFMKGYERDSAMMAKLTSTVVKALDKHPNLRLGQLLVGVLSKYTGKDNITDFLFYVHDEDLLKLLDEF